MSNVFVVGTGRCGSSLLHELIARHRDVAFLSNIDDRLQALGLRGRFNNQIFRRWPSAWSKKGRLRFAPSEGYNAIRKNVSSIYVRPFRDLTSDDVTPWLAERFGAFFDEFRCAQGKSVFVHKYTGWSRIGFFARIFPDARFLHVIRDGRAVANSWLKMPWWDGYEGPDRWLWGPLSSEELATWEANKRSFCVLAGLGWSRLIESYELARLGVDDSRFKEIRYEDLLLDPEKVLSEALDFAGLPTNVDIARIVEQVNVGCGKRDGFHHDLGSDCMDALNSILGERLARYGYYCD